MSMRCHWVKSTLSILLLLGLCGCGHLFYYPTNYLYVDLKKVMPAPEQVEFKNADGLKLVGWYFKSPQKTKANILFFHGNAENISSHFLALHWILNYGYSFFIFDYPGYGGSEGKPTQESTTLAGQKSLEWLKANHPDTPIVIFGQSLGGNIAMYTAANNQQKIPQCLVAVESTFKSYKKVGQRVLANHWFTWPLQWIPWLAVPDKFSATDRIDRISPTPLLVIHGEADPVVVIANGQDVFAAAKEPKEFWSVPQTSHIQAFWGPHGPQYREKFIQTLDRHCAD